MLNVSAVAGGVGRDCSSGTSFVVCGSSASIVFMNNVSSWECSWALGVSALDCGMLSSTSASLLPLRIVVVNLWRYLRIWPRRPCSKAESRGGDGGIPDRLVDWYSWGSPIKLLSDGVTATMGSNEVSLSMATAIQNVFQVQSQTKNPVRCKSVQRRCVPERQGGLKE